MRICGGKAALVVLGSALMLAGCAGSGSDGDSFLGSMFGGSSEQKPAANAQPAAEAGATQRAPLSVTAASANCPPVEINPGAGTYRVFETGKQGDVMAVRYQATMQRMARECHNMGAEMAINVGITGRIIIGPKGAPGKLTIPLRIVVVDGANQPIFSQLRQVPADVGTAGPDSEFSHVEQGVLVPMDDKGMRGWRVLVGFDESATAGKRS